MKILSRVLVVLLILVGVLIAVSNAQHVEMALWPLPYTVGIPLYLLVVALLLVGVLAGFGLGWWAGRHHRRRARERASEAARLEREVARLRDTLAGREAKLPEPGVHPVPREQKAIERQSALVAPELVPPSRGPLVS